jgi:hypothetical protein
MTIIHNLLVVGNAIIISGGSLLAGGHQSVSQFNSNLLSAKVMRTVGQAIFLTINAFLLYCILRTIQECRREHNAVHPTLRILLATWPLLFVRGIYGVLAAVVPAFNYFNFDNYDATGLKDGFVISEYILGTTMEWTSCAFLMLTWVTSRNDPKKADFGKDSQIEKGGK